jgi:UDP:flavonoid glycosyltransferase YjiC (YdhE family)
MRVGIIAVGSRGDIQPYAALGKGLQQAGYEVCVMTHEAFEGLVRSENLEFFAVGGDPRTLVNHVMNEANANNKPNEIAIMSKLIPLLRPLGREILERCWQRCQDIDALVLNVLGIVMGVPIAQKRGIPAFPAYLQPMTPTREFPAVPAWLNPQIRATYNLLSA